MRAVTDADPLIHLSWVNRLDLLEQLFEEIYVAAAVRDEVLRPPDTVLGVPALKEAFATGEFQVRNIENPRELGGLGAGETSALALASELGINTFLSDDQEARSEAERLGLSVLGTVGILRLARDHQMIPAAHPLLLELRHLGLWLSDTLFQSIAQEERSANQDT